MTSRFSAFFSFLSSKSTVIVYGIWAIFSALILLQVAMYGVNMPQWDDWTDMIPVITGKQPLTASWLWSPNGGRHRVFVPRLIEIGMLRLSGNDFRASMFLSGVCLILASLFFLAALRQARTDRKTHLSDVFVPLLVLNWSHYANVLWAYQIQFLFMVLLLSILWYLIVRSRETWSGLRIAVMATILFLLPMCGSNGLVFVPLFALWLIWSGITFYRSPLLSVIGAAALAWCAACFVPVNQGSGMTTGSSLTNMIWVGNQILSFGFGMAALPVTAEDGRMAQLVGRISLLIVLCLSLFWWQRRTKNSVLVWIVGAGLIALALVLRHFRPVANVVPVLLILATCLAATITCWRMLRSSSREQRTQGAAFFALFLSSVLLIAALIVGRSGSGSAIRYSTLAMLPLLFPLLVISSGATESKAQISGGTQPTTAFERACHLTAIALIVVMAPFNFHRVRSILAATTPPVREKLQAIGSGVSMTRFLARNDLSTAPDIAYKWLPVLRSSGIPPYKSLHEETSPKKYETILLDTAQLEGVERSADGKTFASSQGGRMLLPLRNTFKNPVVRTRYSYVGAKSSDPMLHIQARNPAGSIVSSNHDEMHFHDDFFPNQATMHFVDFDGDIAAIVIVFPSHSKVTLNDVAVWEEK